MSDGFIIIDRRKNQKGAELSNRQRFVERARKAIRESAKKALGNRKMSDYGSADVSIPSDGVDEPRFRYESDFGEYDYVLPGNTEYVVGDEIKKPKNQQGGGRGKNGGSGEGDGEDDFAFNISYDEYLDVIFDDLELPDLIKQTEKNAIAFVNRRAGHTNSGMPSNLNVERTAVAGIARRIALRAPKFKKIHELEAELDDLKQIAEVQVFAGPDLVETNRRIVEVEEEIRVLRAKANSIGYLDDVDLRYNNFVKQPRPMTKAVMICIMDVSYSMGEREKIIAKKFFILLHLFLMRRYKDIEVVFIRHHDKASECDEETFFTDRSGGGTVVSTAYSKAKEIIADRYNPDDWNIYVAQASDGDNFDHDNPVVTKFLSEDILPVVQHFTYIEIEDEHRNGMMSSMFGAMTSKQNSSSSLWQTIAALTHKFENISAAQITNEREVIQVFRKLFKKEMA